LLLGDLRAVLFDSQRMTTLLTDSFVRSGAVSTYIAELFSEKIGGETQITSYLTQAHWADLVRTLFPASWQEEQIAANLDECYAWLDSLDPLPRFSFSLTAIKAELQGEGGKSLAEALVNSWPACSAQQLQAYGSGAFTQGALPICRPPDPLLGEVQQGVGLEISQQAGQLPDNLNLSQASPAAGGTAALKTELRLFRDFAPVAWLLPLLLLLVELALAARSVQGLLAWTGIPLATAALIGVLLVLLLGVWRDAGLIPWTAIPAALRTSAASLLGLLLRSLSGRLLIESAVLLFFGFVLVVFSAVVRPRPQLGPAANRPVDRAASKVIHPTETCSPRSEAGAAATRGSTVILPKDSLAEESASRRTPPRGMFG
jgi:hypothetical protein